MVNLTRIYTRTGDGGETRLGDMSVTTKNDPRLQAYADVDEANAHLGLALATGGLDDDVVGVLTHVQNDLFDVGADLCTPVVDTNTCLPSTFARVAPPPCAQAITRPHVSHTSRLIIGFSVMKSRHRPTRTVPLSAGRFRARGRTSARQPRLAPPAAAAGN